MIHIILNEPMFLNKIVWAIENGKDCEYIINLIEERLNFLHRYEIYLLPDSWQDTQIFEMGGFVLDIESDIHPLGVLEMQGEKNSCPKCNSENIRILWNRIPNITVNRYYQCRNCKLYYYFCGIKHIDGSETHWN